MKKLFWIVSCIAGSGILFVACVTTRLTIVWMDEAYSGHQLDNIMVIGVSDRIAMRRSFEDKFVTQLKAVGVRAVSSAAVVPGERKLTKEAMEPEIKRLGIDAVLITHLVGVEKGRMYHPPETHVIPRTYRYYHHYYVVYDYVHTPSYYSAYKIVRLETNIFDSKSGKLVWSAQSRTLDPESAEKLMDVLISLVINDLRKKKLLK